MAEDRRITIEIIGMNGEGKQDEDKPKDPYEAEQKANSTLSSMLKKASHPIESLKDSAVKSIDKRQHPLARIGAAYIAEQGAKTVLTLLDHDVTRHLSLTEDYLSQNTYNMVKSQYNLFKGAVGGVLTGAASGAMAGGIPGAILGAVGGALNFGVNTVISQNQRYSQYYQQLNATNFNTQYNEKRAGLYDGSRGTEN